MSPLNTNSTTSNTLALRKFVLVTKNNFYTICLNTEVNASKKSLFAVLFQNCLNFYDSTSEFDWSWYLLVPDFSSDETELWLYMKELNTDARIIKLNISTNLKFSSISPLSSMQHNRVSMLVADSRNWFRLKGFFFLLWRLNEQQRQGNH